MTDDWVKVTNIEQYKTNYTISDLEFDVTFMFGVTAENDVGVSGRCDIETSVKMEKPSGMWYRNFSKGGETIRYVI